MATKSERINEVLRALRQGTPEVIGASVVSSEGFIVASVLLAYAISRGLQHRISRPILELAETATAIEQTTAMRMGSRIRKAAISRLRFRSVGAAAESAKRPAV